MAKVGSLKTLQDEWHGCQRCGLGKERSGPHIVFGLGQPRAKFLFIYDAPTETDAVASMPMAGTEGDLMVALAEQAKITLDQMYCTPLVACRPTVLLPATDREPARIADRAADKAELKACIERVHEIIYRLDPLLIFTLGPVSYLQLVRGPDRGTHTTLEKAIGSLHVTRLPGRYLDEVTYDVMPLMGMPQIMAKPSNATHGPLAVTAQNMHKGRTYALYAEETGRRDAQALGLA